jgi:hypothetical protein
MLALNCTHKLKLTRTPNPVLQADLHHLELQERGARAHLRSWR